MDGDEANPGVNLVRQSNQVIRAGEKGLNQDPEEAKQDGHLDYHRAQATDGADSRFPVKPHRLLGNPCPVALVSLLDLPHLRLEPGHGPHLVELFEGEGQRHHAYQHGERYDCQAHVTEENNVQHHQGVEHGTDDYLVPE